MKLRIGTRKSRLAMIQTEIVRDAILARFPEMEIELVPMNTKGDQILDRSLTSFGGKGVFTVELEEALRKGEVDMAVHSAKDMPMGFPEGLCVGAVLDREEAADVLVTRSGIPAKELPAGSVIGTSSLRRQLQIRNINPLIVTKMLRGNVQTRLEKLRQGQYDGILLASAGLKRLGLENPEGLHLEYLDKETFVPAAGQGILAVEIREGELAEVMEAIHSERAETQLFAEREFLRILGGGCNAPCGAWCREEDGALVMTVMHARDGVHPKFYRSQAAEGESAGALALRMAAAVQYKPVCLVGAGPGDGGLITKKGLECLRQADVVVYDNLISGSLLNEAPLDAELIYVGKRSGNHHKTQDEINQILVQKAREGGSVVRLKGGDPFIFGRGGEEALALHEQGIPYEIVPGVSSVYSVPAYGGIPVTHRGLASSFHVITGHEGREKQTIAGQKGGKKAVDVLDYGVLAKAEGTLVFLMGLERLETIAEQLMVYGKSGETPAAVIEKGTTAGQRMVCTDLAHIAEKVRESGLKTPAVIVVGDAAALSGKLSWFGGEPLSGKRILLTGTRYMARELEEELRPLGAECVSVSLIESRPLWTKKTKAAIADLSQYDWLVFTSSNGVDLFFQMMREQGQDLRQLMHVKFAAIGRKTADALSGHGFLCDFVPESFSGTDLAKEWIPMLPSDTRVLLLRAKDGSEVLPRELKKAGIDYEDVPIYETWLDRRRKEELNRLIGTVDYVAVASSSAVRALGEMLEDPVHIPAKVVSIGPYTTKTAREAGIPVYADAVEYTAAGIAAVIMADLEEMNHGNTLFSDICKS